MEDHLNSDDLQADEEVAHKHPKSSSEEITGKGRPLITPAKGFPAALASLPRELSTEDLDSPGSRKILLAQFDKLTEDAQELEKYKTLFFEADKERAVLKESIKGYSVNSTKSAIGIALGGLLCSIGGGLLTVADYKLLGAAIIIIGIATMVLSCWSYNGGSPKSKGIK